MIAIQAGKKHNVRINEMMKKASGLKHFLRILRNTEFVETKNKVGQNNQMTIEHPYIADHEANMKVSENIEKLQNYYR